MPNYTAKRSDFSRIFKEYLSEEKDFVDVTLACDGNLQIRAHKVILSTGSLFFRDILANMKHPEPFIFLSGVQMSDLQRIIEFIYTGETSIPEDQIEIFLNTARTMQISGLEKASIVNNANNDEGTRNIDKTTDIDNTELYDADSESEESGIEKEIVVVKKRDTSVHDNEEVLVNKCNEEPEGGVPPKAEKVDGIKCDCISCGKTRIRKPEVKRHADFLSSRGSNHPCTLCIKILKSRTELREHVKSTHSENLNCSACGRKRMTQKQLFDHMNVHKPSAEP